MDKRWIMVGCAVVLITASGCRSARYRVQRYYKYPPTYAASAAPPQQAPAATMTPSALPKVQTPPASAGAAKPSQVSSNAPASTAAPSVSTPEKKPTKTGWWKRLFGGRDEAPPPSVAAKKSAEMAATNAAAAASPKEKPETPAASVYRLKVGDPIVVYLRGIPGAPGGEQQIENVVGEDGTIPLPFVDNIRVLNMTASEAQEVIRRAYVDGQIYRQLTVNVIIPARSYYIRGEVRQPGRYPLVGTVTVLQAIAAAGGYTEFASYSVEIVRGDRRLSLNMRQVEKRPELDMSIEPGDIIVVNRSFF
jgi:protein involved in polysaccharide export with SLBB domain